mgnify:CR=1 FL=1
MKYVKLVLLFLYFVVNWKTSDGTWHSSNIYMRKDKAMEFVEKLLKDSQVVKIEVESINE